MANGLWFALVCAIVALVYGAVSIKWILGQPAGNDRMREIARRSRPEPRPISTASTRPSASSASCCSC